MNRHFTHGLAVLLATLALAWTTPVLAVTECLTAFADLYPGSLTDDNANCATCHQSTSRGSGFNAYGAALRNLSPNFCQSLASTQTLLRSLESANSDGDLDVNGNPTSNIQEINANTQPGWCVAASTGCSNQGTPPTGIAGLLDPVVDPANTPPVADAGGPYMGDAGNAIQFDGSRSTDADNDPLSYSWNFGDTGTGTGAMPTHTYLVAGEYTVNLTVSDGKGGSDSATVVASISTPVSETAPVADAGGPYSGSPGEAIQFDGSGSSDANGDPLSYTWDFGDGSPTSSEASPSHTYDTVGDYIVSLVVNDGSQDSEADVTTASISEPPPAGSGEALYVTNCQGCHGDPWAEPAFDENLPGLRRLAGARECTLQGSIFGTSVFPGGVPEMQDLQGVLSEGDIAALAEYLNSADATGEQRYVTACAGCHGADATGGRTRESVRGEEADETAEAIEEEREMRFLACLPSSDINSISDYLMGIDNDNDHDGIDNEHDDDDDNDGIKDEDDDDDDNDGLDDVDEHRYGCDPSDHDSDDDDLDDGEEVYRYGTDPDDSDTDDDGYSDSMEIIVMKTDPLVPNNSAQATGDSGGGGGMAWWSLIGLLAAAGLARTRRREALLK